MTSEDERENENSVEGAGEAQERKAQRLEAERQDILSAVANVQLTTLQKRVAWLLNHSPEARDSDITLQIKYWETFESDIYQGVIRPDDLYKLTRLTSIARSRAAIQNNHGLFLASEEVRKYRGKLASEEKVEQREARKAASTRSYTVHVDESGKSSDYLIVGSCWLLNGIESLGIAQDIIDWRKERDFHDELHFAKLGRGSLNLYLEALDILYKRAPAISFKAVSLPRSGISDVNAAIEDMIYHLIVRGVEHESSSGRAELPRVIQLWKDRENEGQDALTLANLKDRLQQAAKGRFDDQLFVGEMFSVDSKASPFLEFTDLFVSSANRYLMRRQPDSDHPKDVFARELLNRFGARPHRADEEENSDFVYFEDI